MRLQGQTTVLYLWKTVGRDFVIILKKLEKPVFESKKAAAIVMNVQSFYAGTSISGGKAGGRNDIVHLFVVSEDASLVPFAVEEAGCRRVWHIFQMQWCMKAVRISKSDATFASL